MFKTRIKLSTKFVFIIVLLVTLSFTSSIYALNLYKSPHINTASNTARCHNGDSDTLGNGVDVDTVIAGISPQRSVGHGTASAYESLFGCPIGSLGLYTTVETSYYHDADYKPVDLGGSATKEWNTGEGMTGSFFGVSARYCTMSVSAISWLGGYCES